MDEIGSLLKETRESSGVSISEACKDLDVNELSIENIESGKIGSFKDVFELKKLIYDYSKYLGLDSDKIIDDFNYYLFEYTSKIPVKELEKTIELKFKEENEEKNKVVSPYTKVKKKADSKYYILVYVLIALLVVLAMAWAIRQVTIARDSATVISYRR